MFQIHQKTVVTLILTGASGLVCVFTNIPLLQNGAFIMLMLSSVAPNVVNAATVEVYPTALRYSKTSNQIQAKTLQITFCAFICSGMAICIALMFSRLGSVFGANGSAMLLDEHCETVFYVSACALLGNSYANFVH